MALENSGAVGAPETRSVNGDFVGDLEEGELGEEVEDRTPVTNHVGSFY